MKKYSLIVFFVLLVLYTLFQARYLVVGPRIVVDTPKDSTLIDAGIMVVSGVAKNTIFLSLDDRQVYTDIAGRFEEKLIAHVGINIIKLEARDRFGRETEVLVRVIAN